ncbi:helix-turn-helix domain-containing protein [Cnuibacter sp. UC19_7]|uniref:helix-turn-helix transcriptional regulator n=1 Tax=Cnuibacter sp. UC19_7 TaxID=3350166 RepID=UPI0036706781
MRASEATRTTLERALTPTQVRAVDEGRLDPEQRDSWSVLLEHTTRILESSASPAVTEALLSAIRVAADEALPAVSGPAPSAHVRLAVEYIERHAADDISVDDIASASALSVRGLQSVFRRELDSTPLRVLGDVRMTRVRSDLCSAVPGDGTSVASVMVRWRVGHQGRFAHAYAQRYGEFPRETLAS